MHEHLLKKVMFLCCFVVVTTETCMELFSREGEFCLFFFSLFILHVMKIIVLSLCFYVNCFSLCFFPALRFIIFKKPHQANHLALIEWIECKWSLVFFFLFFYKTVIRNWCFYRHLNAKRKHSLDTYQSPFSQSRNLFLNIILQIIGLICFILMSLFFVCINDADIKISSQSRTFCPFLERMVIAHYWVS